MRCSSGVLIRIALFTILIAVLGLRNTLAAVEQLGRTYEIAEKDALTEIEEKAATLDWSKITAGAEEKIKNFTPPNLPGLMPDADRERVREVDMTYTLTFDITDSEGNILYPKGYSFNVLDYIKYPRILVFIDGDRESHIKWFEQSPYLKDYNVDLLITKGSYYSVMKRLKRPVFYATRLITERFGIERLPSVARQKGRSMEVREIPVKEQKSRGTH